jgi:hypothetical protein
MTRKFKSRGMTHSKNLLSLKSRNGDGKERELVLRVSSGGPTQWRGCSLYPAAIARFID